MYSYIPVTNTKAENSIIHNHPNSDKKPLPTNLTKHVLNLYINSEYKNQYQRLALICSGEKCRMMVTWVRGFLVVMKQHLECDGGFMNL